MREYVFRRSTLALGGALLLGAPSAFAQRRNANSAVAQEPASDPNAPNPNAGETVLEAPVPTTTKEPDAVQVRSFPHISKEPVATRWYGWQIAIADGASIGTAVTSFAIGRSAYGVATLGTASWGLTPAVIHLIHGREAAAGTSVGLRLLAPVGGFLAAYGYVALQGRGCFDNQRGCVTLGVIGGGVVAALATAYDIVNAKEPVVRKSRPSAIQWAPTFAVTPVSRGSRVASSLRDDRTGLAGTVGVVGSF